MALHRLGHDRQCCLRQQFHPLRISLVPAATSVGLAELAVLAQVNRSEVNWDATRAYPHAIPSVALPEIDFKVASCALAVGSQAREGNRRIMTGRPQLPGRAPRKK